MQTNVFLLLIVIGATFSLIAAAMAFLITYSQSRKFYRDKKQVRNAALQSALFMFILFMVISLVIALYFGGQELFSNPS
jgi:hypothetical protein